MKISKSNITNITIEECHQLMLRLPPKTKSEEWLASYLCNKENPEKELENISRVNIESIIRNALICGDTIPLSSIDVELYTDIKSKLIKDRASLYKDMFQELKKYIPDVTEDIFRVLYVMSVSTRGFAEVSTIRSLYTVVRYSYYLKISNWLNKQHKQ